MSQNHLLELAQELVKRALDAGATDAECTIAEGEEFSANVRMLVAGGPALAVLTVIAVANLWIQDGIGIGVAHLVGANPATGLLAGSVGLSGGHGTAIAWAATLKSKFDLPNALEIGTAAATLAASLVARWDDSSSAATDSNPRQPGRRASVSRMRRKASSSSTSTECCIRCSSSRSQSELGRS